MFHKPFRVKSNTAIKGSDRRKVRADIGNQFPGLSDDDLRRIIPNKEEMTIMKLYTHAGDNVIVYCLHKNPVFFEVEKKLYPTVYTVWTYQNLVPLFTTWPPVFNNLAGGADLMLPGVVPPAEGIPQVKKGNVCAINLAGNQAAVAIGAAIMSTSDMFEAGMRGKGIRVVHTYQDQLWNLGEKIALPMIPMETQETRTTEKESVSESNDSAPTVEDMSDEHRTQSENLEEIGSNVTELTANMAAVDIEDTQTETAQDGEDKGGEESVECVGAIGGVDEETEDDSRTPTEQMDELLFSCFCHALKSNVKKTDLPLLTSKFFRSHILAVCPPGKYIDVKKSSYKKLSKFLDEMKKKGFIEMKELQKGVDSVTAIHKEHPVIRSFTIPEYSTESVPETETAPPSGEYHPPEILEYYSVNALTLPVFQFAGYKKGAWLKQQEVRSIITEYIKINNLVDKSQVALDPVLTDALLKKGEYHISHLKWDELFQRCYKAMGNGYHITFPLQPAIRDTGVKKGKIPAINITVEQRTGNKKVTLVQNLETFGIEPKAFGHKVQVNVAASTSLTPVAGKTNSQQVLIQGNQINYIAQLLLDEFQIPRKYIQGLEKAPKSGKKKR
ncbi:eukaryotic translation initiation factor 2D-like [Glandiceps talaboti]